MALIRKEFQKLSNEALDLIHSFNRGRDGYCCQFCKIKGKTDEECKFNVLDPKKKQTNHHLNGNQDDNRPINICDAHEECNRTERIDFDLELISNEILNSNFKRQSIGEYDEINTELRRIYSQKIHEEDSREHPERVSNRLYFQLSEEELARRTVNGEDVPYLTIMRNVMSLHYQATGGKIQGGGGSEKPARQAIDTLCSDYGEYEIFKKKTARYIRKRLN